jgi:hypothetical protein
MLVRRISTRGRLRRHVAHRPTAPIGVSNDALTAVFNRIAMPRSPPAALDADPALGVILEAL